MALDLICGGSATRCVDHAQTPAKLVDVNRGHVWRKLPGYFRADEASLIQERVDELISGIQDQNAIKLFGDSLVCCIQHTERIADLMRT